MTGPGHALLLGGFLFPLLMLAASLTARGAARVPRLLALAPVPALLAALLTHGAPPLVFHGDWLRLTLGLDGPSALLLGVAALLWAAAGGYAVAYRMAGALRFAQWWLLTMSGSLGVFIANDLVTFYFAFAVVSLAAYGLVVHDGTARARRAGSVYILLAVLGEICLLLAFALLAVATPGPSLAIRDVVAGLAQSPWQGATVTLLVLGFGLKAGLVPLHVWLPLAHPAAPMPASAVLSGAIIKAGVIGLLRFLPDDGSVPGLGAALAALGFATAFYAVLVGITQSNPKTVLAYSSVSQMGVVVAAIGLAGAPMAVAFYAAHHVLAKGALFLAVGVALATGPRRLWWVLLPVAVIALGFGGLPLSGGAAAKAALKAPMGEGLPALLAVASAMGSALLMLHFLRRLRAAAAETPEGATPPGMVLPCLLLGIAAVALPWLLLVPLGAGKLADALHPAALWPVLAGAALAAILPRLNPRLPAIPEGDVLLPMERAAARLAAPLSAAAQRLEAAARTWPNSGLALLGLVLALAGVMLAAPP